MLVSPIAGECAAVFCMRPVNLRPVNFRALLAVVRRCYRVQSEQAGRNPLSAGGRGRDQSKEGHRSAKCDDRKFDVFYLGRLEEFQHENIPFGWRASKAPGRMSKILAGGPHHMATAED